MQHFRPWFLALACVLVGGPAVALATPDSEPKPAPKPAPDPKAAARAAANAREMCKAAQADIDEIERLTRSPKASNDDLLQYLAAVAHTMGGEIALLVAAHKAIPLFENVPGTLRYAIVTTFLETYAPEEAKAARTPAGKPGDVLPGALAVVQHYAGSPRASGGERLATLQALETWFRTHKDPRKAPWVDP